MIRIGFSGWVHHKNEKGISLMNEENFGICFSNLDSGQTYDYVMITNSVSGSGNFTKGIIFGPHIDFRNSEMSSIPKNEKTYINFLSPWLLDLANIVYPNKNLIDLPFPVDINRFCPSEKNGKPVVYFKRRERKILDDFFTYRNREDFILYDYGSYGEEQFRSDIAKAPYCVWIGCHESQGFAFQETLSSNTPIFVIDVNSLRDEVGVWDSWMPDLDLKATSASYFDSRCGMISSKDTFREDFPIFIDSIGSLSPRNFILETLSPRACINKWIKTLE